MTERRAFTFRNLVIIAVFGMLLLAGGVYFGLSFAVERAVKVDAKQKAEGWAGYFIETMPALEQLLVTGRLTAAQQSVVAAAESLGDVFRFKLFDLNGNMVLVSDEATYNAENPATREHSEKAAGVLRTGLSNISVNDGTGKENRPPLYAEAYVPVIDGAGETVGIVEVYMDQTKTAELFHTTFAALAYGLAAVAALAFGLPTLAFLLRSRQASEAKQRVEFLAHHDPMTGLLNRSSFNDRLEAGLGAADGRTVAVAFIDVDDFKAINDTYGHEAGDEFLRHVARAITGCTVTEDVAARIGGDEFTVAFAGRDAAAVTEAVEHMLLAIREPITIRGRMVAGRASAGLYLIDAETTGLADVTHNADVALYQAKIDGGNTYRLFSLEMEAAMQARRALELLIREAAASEGFVIHYQPLLHAGNRRCAGFEALLRLPDGQGGLVPPATFIPVAEAMGLINEIGKWVIERATRTAASWPAELFVSVNLSVRQFHDGQLVENVRQALAASGLRPGQLELEVTESMLMENTETIAAQLGALRELGVSIAMDDFGTGYSSLGYLWQFGFDKLKIDRSFVSALDVPDSQARDILDTIIMLGHKLEMTVTAEGIETEHQASVLAALACDHFQGFLYGRPAPEEAIAGFLLGSLQASEERSYRRTAGAA